MISITGESREFADRGLTLIATQIKVDSYLRPSALLSAKICVMGYNDSDEPISKKRPQEYEVSGALG